jgi:predicted ArsR family transcriptional regulator
MRPQGEVRTTVAEGLSAGPGMTRELAQRVGLDVQATRKTLDNMRNAGQVVVVGEERVPGVRRPVPVYDLAERRPSSWSLLQCWSLGRALG